MRRKMLLIGTLLMVSVFSLTACTGPSVEKKAEVQENVNDLKSEDEGELVEADIDVQDVEENEPISTESDAKEVNQDENQQVFDDSLSSEDIANMNMDEFEAYEVEFRKQSEENWKKYEDAKEAPMERDVNGGIPFTLYDGKVTFIYHGEADIQSISEEGNDFIFIHTLDKSSSIGLGLYDSDDYRESMDIVRNLNHLNTDVNGNEYYTGTSTLSNTHYYLFDCFDAPVLGVVNIEGDFTIDDISIIINQ